MIAALIILALVVNGAVFLLFGAFAATTAGHEGVPQSSTNVASFVSVTAGLSFALFLAVLLGVSV